MLTTPEARRGLRAIVQAMAALAGMALLAWIISLSEGRGETLAAIAYGLLGLAAMRELFYGSENVTRALKFSIGRDGVTADMGDDGKAAGQ